MTNNEMPRQDNSGQWSEFDAYQLYKFMDSTQPTLQSRDSQDPIVLAQEYQHTMDGVADPQIRKIMGNAGEETLNSIAPNQITYRHLAIVTNRLIVLSEPGKEVIGDYTTKALVTGLFDRFAFEEEPDVEKDWLTIKLLKPDFLFTESRRIAIELFDANKTLVSVDARSQLMIPVEAVQGRVYDPETLI